MVVWFRTADGSRVGVHLDKLVEQARESYQTSGWWGAVKTIASVFTSWLSDVFTAIVGHAAVWLANYLGSRPMAVAS